VRHRSCQQHLSLGRGLSRTAIGGHDEASAQATSAVSAYRLARRTVPGFRYAWTGETLSGVRRAISTIPPRCACIMSCLSPASTVRAMTQRSRQNVHANDDIQLDRCAQNVATGASRIRCPTTPTDGSRLAWAGGPGMRSAAGVLPTKVATRPRRRVPQGTRAPGVPRRADLATHRTIVDARTPVVRYAMIVHQCSSLRRSTGALCTESVTRLPQRGFRQPGRPRSSRA
jgi:hypothetical protein